MSISTKFLAQEACRLLLLGVSIDTAARSIVQQFDARPSNGEGFEEYIKKIKREVNILYLARSFPTRQETSSLFKR